MLAIIGGKFKKNRLVTPKGGDVRPTTAQLREALFNICQMEIQAARFLDLFAGSGAIGFEALSRGAAEVTFVEKQKEALGAIKKNIASLNVDTQCKIFGCDVWKALQQLCDKGETFHMIYADPPYGRGMGRDLLAFLETHSLLAPGGSLFIEDEELTLPELQHLHMRSQRKASKTAYLYHFIV